MEFMSGMLRLFNLTKKKNMRTNESGLGLGLIYNRIYNNLEYKLVIK